MYIMNSQVSYYSVILQENDLNMINVIEKKIISSRFIVTIN